MRAARFRLDEMLRLGDVPEVVRVGIRQLRQLHARADGAFHHLKTQPVIEGAEDADDAVRLLVDMGGDGDAAEPLYEGGSFFDGDAGRDDEQVFFLADDLVVLVHDILAPEDLRLVSDTQARFCDIRFQLFEIFIPFEQAEDMDIFARRELHAGQYDQPVLFADRHRRGAVFARVVVGQGDDVQPLDERHVHDVVGRAVAVAAGA